MTIFDTINALIALADQDDTEADEESPSSTDEAPDNSDEAVAARRAMFEGFGWTR